MGNASIPVDLFNPGEVFACLGFLEAAEELLADAEGGFDWSDEADVRFVLQTAGEENPFAVVLEFLADADVRAIAPSGEIDLLPMEKCLTDDAGIAALTVDHKPIQSSVFPDRKGDRMALPVRLSRRERPSVDLAHWADGSGRNRFKLYAGNRSAFRIACAMLHGTRTKPTKRNPAGDPLTEGLATLWRRDRNELTMTPFDVLTLMGGSFNFDPRGAWTALDAGYSPNEQKKHSNKHHGIAASPVVEILAAWGLSRARPDEYRTRRVRYGAWRSLVPPLLARPALAGVNVAGPVRRFRFTLDLSGKNKVVTFAEEEINI